MQFGFIPEGEATDVLVILRRFQKKYLAKKKGLHFTFIDLEEAFNQVSYNIVGWFGGL